MSPIFDFLDLAAPFLAAGALLICILKLRDSGGDPIRWRIPLPWVEVPLPVRNIVWQRVLLGASVFAFLAFPAFRDYTVFFPTHLDVQAFFDDDGVGTALKELTSDELARLHVANDWPARKQRYFDALNAELNRQSIGKFQFDTKQGVVHSVGENTIEAKRIHGWRQRYQLIGIRGFLEHVVQRPGQEPAKITSEFEILENSDSVIELSLANIFLAKPILILPEFKQLMKVSPMSEIYDHNLIAATKIDLFPLIDVEASIYLWTDADGRRVPIGYALYSHQ